MRHGNARRGSGIVSVLVGMLFIAALGTALLYTSYTAMRIKAVERGSQQNFYSAETAMSEIRSGVQKAVTESIATAYTDVLQTYNASAEDPDVSFQNAFLSALTTWQSSDGRLITPGSEANTYRYSPDVLQKFVSVSALSKTVVSGGGTIEIRENAKGQTSSVVLKDIAVNYTDNGYTDTVRSDIAVSMPAFSYTLSEYSLNGVPEFAVIADKGLSQYAGGSLDLVIQGNAYAGKVTLEGANNTLTLRNGTLICGGGSDASDRSGIVSVSGATTGGSARFLVDGTAAIWARRVQVEGGSSVKLAGDAYLADDLELSGNLSSAVLAGRYFGFGYVSPDSASINADGVSGRSSAILVNGMGTKLDLSGLNYLMLAGNSYISKGSTAESGADALMGESLSVKSDQRAYLIPAESISLQANPYLFSSDEQVPTPEVDLNTVLWTDNGVSKKLSDYVDPVKGYKTVIVPLHGHSGMNLMYVFMQFASKDKANEYFRAYFEHNAAKVKAYLNAYVTLSGSAKSAQSSGSTYAASGTDVKLLDGTTQSVLRISSDRLKKMYENLCVTLSANVSAESASADSPFTYVVKKDKLPAGTTRFQNAAGETAAITVNGADYTISGATPDSVHVVICTGNVTVGREYHGLIIAGGAVEMGYSVYVSRDDVKGAFSAKQETDQTKTLLDYLNISADIGSGSSAAGGVTSWNPDAMVSYENWKKN